MNLKLNKYADFMMKINDTYQGHVGREEEALLHSMYNKTLNVS